MNTPPLNASARIMYQEAISRGITCHTFEDHETILMQAKYGQWYTRGSRTSLQSSVGYTIASEKPLTKKILEYYNLPTAKYRQTDTKSDLEKISNLKFPLVMKPLNQSHGRGVIVGIKDQKEAVHYFQKAQQEVIFEEMLLGTEYRIVCVDFKFVAAAFRKAAFVTGDGSQTISQLIEEKNKHPWRGESHTANLTLIKIDETVEKKLADEDLRLDSIPEKGHEVYLRKTVNLSTGGEAWDVTESVCPENQELFEKIAKACDLNTIGIDVMCQSLETPIISQNQAGVIEVNASLGLRMHHFPMQGQSKNIASLILDMVEQKLKAQNT